MSPQYAEIDLLRLASWVGGSSGVAPLTPGSLCGMAVRTSPHPEECETDSVLVSDRSLGMEESGSTCKTLSWGSSIASSVGQSEASGEKIVVGPG